MKTRLAACSALKPVLLAVLSLAFTGCISPRSNTIVATPTETCDDAAPAPAQIRVASYNIKSASHNGDRMQDLAEVLRGLDADVVGLQEVQTHEIDQASELARMLGYKYHVFAAAIRKTAGDYGVAILSRIPFERVERVRLDYPLASESRVAIDAVACVGKKRMHFVNTHVDFLPLANTGNTTELARYLRAEKAESVVLMGDLNATPREETIKRLTDLGLRDLFAEKLAEAPESFTFPSDRPDRRIDYFLVDASLVDRARSPRVPATQASDHRPIFTTFDLSGW
jgi:endonuclease/exonuclease/phosphatase family metal-dependent hydrolase